MSVDLHSIYGILEKIFLQEGRLFFFLLFTNLGMHAFMWRMEYHKFNKRYFEKFFSSFFFLLGAFLFCGILSLVLPSFIWNGIKWGIIFLTSFLFLFEIGIFYEYQMFLTNRTFSVLMQTNHSEAGEFLKELFSFWFIFLILCSGLSLYFVPLLFSKLFFFLLNNSVSQFFLGALCSIAVIFFVQGSVPSKIKRYYSYISAIRIFIEFQVALRKEKENKKALDEQRKIKIKIYEQDEKAETVILVIGESASRHYLQVYGYYLPTTPFAQQEKEKGNLFAFDNVISPDSLTALVVPQIMTSKNYEEKKEWYHCPNLISTFKAAGYKTYWISNQPKNEAIGKVFSRLSDVSFFGEEKRIDDEGYDNILLKEGLPLIGKEKKRLIVFHLIGSHNSYAKRYPKEDAIFREEDVRENQRSRVKKYIVEYCNSLRYTDFILEEIINYFKEENTLLFYLSDHAEEMYESRNVRGHSGDNGSRYMIEIPMFVYSSKKFQEKNKEFWDACHLSIHRPYSSDDFIHSLLDASGIYPEFYEETKNIFSKNFDETRKRMYLGKDYDAYWKNLEGREKNSEK